MTKMPSTAAVNHPVAGKSVQPKTSRRTSAAGTRLRGHEFHYSTIAEQSDAPLALVTDAEGAAVAESGSHRGHVTGSYFHMIAPASCRDAQ